VLRNIQVFWDTDKWSSGPRKIFLGTTDPEDEGISFVPNVGNHLATDMT
jgi:hypothetical protein